MFDPSLLGRLSFTHAEPTKRPLPPGRNRLGIDGERDAVLFVPTGLEHAPVPLFVMFHGAGGFPEKVLPFIEEGGEQLLQEILSAGRLGFTSDPARISGVASSTS